MDWTAKRLLLAWAAMFGGGWVGFLLGQWWKVPLTAMVAGAAIGLGVLVVVDALQALRLIRWLRGDPLGTLQCGGGLWGELCYRIERALRSRDGDLAREREQRAQFLRAIEASPNGVLLLDAQDRIEWCNAVAADHFGLDAVRDLQQRVTNLVRMPAFVGHLQAGVVDEPIVVGGPDSASALSVLVRPYGEGRRIVLSMDITERQRGEAMRRDFVANVSHEIRTPLTVVAGFIESMQSLALSDSERQRVLVLMRQQTDRMHVLVADLLTLAQLEGSPRPPVDTWCALPGLLQRVEGDARTLSAGRHLLEFPDAVAFEIAGVEGELVSAVGNLVHNAVRYTPTDGRVEVQWWLRPGGEGVLEVCDNGIGIAREHLPRLTERFYRVDGSRSRETGGTGLGLAIVKHVMQRHGGELEVDSEPGKGSRFRLVFPAARVRALGAASARGLTPAGLPA